MRLHTQQPTCITTSLCTSIKLKIVFLDRVQVCIALKQRLIQGKCAFLPDTLSVVFVKRYHDLVSYEAVNCCALLCFLSHLCEPQIWVYVNHRNPRWPRA